MIIRKAFSRQLNACSKKEERGRLKKKRKKERKKERNKKKKEEATNHLNNIQHLDLVLTSVDNLLIFLHLLLLLLLMRRIKIERK